MDKIISTLARVFRNRKLRKQFLFIVIILVIFRLLSNVPIPGADPFRLSQFFASDSLLGVFNLLSGGGLSTLSIIMLGVGPYITSSIIMQLLGFVSPKIKSLQQEEGEMGRKKVSQWTKLLTVPLALAQSFGIITLLIRQGVLAPMSVSVFATNMIVATAGSFL